MFIQNSGGAPKSIEISILSLNRRVCQVTSYSFIDIEEGTGIPYYAVEGLYLTDTQRASLEEFLKSRTFSDACCDATGMVAVLVCEAHDKSEDYRALMISRGNKIYLKIV